MADDPEREMLESYYGQPGGTPESYGEPPRGGTTAADYHTWLANSIGSARAPYREPNAGRHFYEAMGHVSDAVGPSQLALATGITPFKTPIRAYHGATRPVTKFEPHSNHELGPHFGTLDQAHARLGLHADRRAPQGQTDYSIIPADLHIENPLQIPDVGYFSPDKLHDALLKTKRFSEADIKRLAQHSRAWDDADPWSTNRRPEDLMPGFSQDFRDIMRREGYDALKYRNQQETPEVLEIFKMNANRVPHKDLGRIRRNLARSGDFSYVPMERGNVLSPYTGDILYSQGGGV